MAPTFKPFYLTMLVAGFLSLARYGESSHSINMSQKELIETFRKGIELNEKLKMETNLELQMKLRENLEAFDEERLLPALRFYVGMLAINNRLILAKEFLKVILSYGNSSDEELPLLYVELYTKNPDLAEKALKQFNVTDQQKLVSRLIEAVNWQSVGEQTKYEIFKQRLNQLQIQRRQRTKGRS
jgi:hypothetical protein